MPGLGFSGANLATVAYAEVEGAAGTSTTQNSGVTTTRTALGTYVVILPTNLSQPQARDLIFITPRLNQDGSGNASKTYVLDDRLDATKTVTFYANDTTTKIDSSFTILIMRTTIAPPSGAPG